jgi:hypothetical protein
MAFKQASSGATIQANASDAGVLSDQLRNRVYAHAPFDNRAVEAARAFALADYIPDGDAVLFDLIYVSCIKVVFFKAQKACHQGPEIVSRVAVILFFFK